jgi:predicted nucleic acid-binding protein
VILVDSNVLIDLIEPDGAWRNWSEEAILAAEDSLAVNAVVIAEIARQFRSLDDELSFLDRLGAKRLPITDAAAFHAGKAHADYRASGGRRGGILADFLIGGHATALNATLLTRDKRRFAAYFPNLILITPETDDD